MIYNFDNLNFNILAIDLYVHRDGLYEVKSRPYAALSLRTKGFGAFSVENQTFITKPGDIMFIPANTPYIAEYSKSESIVVHMTDCNYTIAEYVPIERKDYFYLMYADMLKDWQKNGSVNSAKANIYSILQALNEKSLKKFDKEFLHALSYINQNFSSPKLKMEDICKVASISESTLYRRFVKYYNITPKQYLLNQKLSFAMNLLIKGDLSIKEIALLSGFVDDKYFSRAFKTHFGYPPSKYGK